MTTEESKNGRALASAAPMKTKHDFSWNSIQAQCKRLLNALRVGSVTTVEARRDLDVMMPAARIHALRHKHGLNIITSRVEALTDAGVMHRVARYTLLAEPQAELAL